MNSPRFSHLGVAVGDIETAISVYRDLFGYSVISGPFDDSIQRASVCFVGTGIPGDLIIELVAPLDEESPMNKMVGRSVGAYHVCYEVDDIDQMLMDARAKGCIIVSRPVPAAAFGGRRIAWFYTPSRQLVEVLEQ
jgi:methylmalonyl-CoA/ethylmalonyl-CoA epimerase